MKDNTSILLTANVSYEQSYVWGHLENTIEKYKSIDPSVFVCICGSGYCPAGVREKYTTIWEPEYNESEYGWKRFLHMMPKVFDVIKNCGKQYLIVSNMLCWLSDPNILDGKLIISGNILNKNSIIEQSIIYGKVRTINNIFLNRTWNDTLSQQSNIYRNVSNVIGVAGMDKYVISNQELGLTKRVIISRDTWEDIKC